MSGQVRPGTTITCQEVVELVTDYLEGAVDEPTRVEIEAHLALCSGCEEYLAQMRQTIQLIGLVPVESLSRQARDELVAAFRTSRPEAARGPESRRDGPPPRGPESRPDRPPPRGSGP